MFRAAAAMLLSLFAMGIAPATEPEVTGWDAISITTEAKVTGRKTAILIANSTYTGLPSLSAPPNDVAAMSSHLAQLGFEIKILRDPTAADIIRTIASANPSDGRGTLLAFYYSGHAAEIDGENSIILTGYDPAERTSSDQILSLKSLLTLLAASEFDKVFVAFDACRNMIKSEPAQEPARTTETAVPAPVAPPGIRGLARVENDFRSLNRKEYAVLFSTSHGEVALDSTIDGISPFTKAFLLALGRENAFVPAMLLAKRLTEEITKGAQSPDVQIKWSGDLTYARSSAAVNRATYVLNEKLSATEMNGTKTDLVSLTTSRKDTNQATLNLNTTSFSDCYQTSKKNFFWSVSTLDIEYCYMKYIGYKQSLTGNGLFSEHPGGAVYNTGKYQSAVWDFDLDFDGSSETVEAELRNSDMALTIIGKTTQFEFRGLLGPNIDFVGLQDFNKDGTLDIFIIYTISGYTNGNDLFVIDGKTVSKELKEFVPCRPKKFSETEKCQNQSKLRSTMIGSILTHDLENGYYGADILQATLYADWNIKNWEINEGGSLEITTYSSTWPYERYQPENYMMNKVVTFNLRSGKFDIALHGETERTLSIAPLKEQIVGTPDSRGTVGRNRAPAEDPAALGVLAARAGLYRTLVAQCRNLFDVEAASLSHTINETIRSGIEIAGAESFSRLVGQRVDAIKAEISASGTGKWCIFAERTLRREGQSVLRSSASFDCTKARSESERTICADRDLSAYDHALATLYKSRTATAQGDRSARLKLDQRNWLKSRERCGTDRACLESAYDQRVDQLE